MAVTSGFFNSVNHDRLYNAEQISSMFDGIILDGIYQGLGDAFIVKPYSDLNCTVTVGTGRAWFDHTWTLNSTELALTLDDPNVLYDRIDAIVIDVDRRQDVRANSIKVVKGTVSETGATKPSLIKEELHNQYPLAYVTVKAGSAAPIQAQYIENMIGKTDTPLVAGVLESMDITMFVQQMEDEFNVWFDGLKDVVSGDAITNLQQQINEINENSIPMKKTLVDILRDGNANESVTVKQLTNPAIPANKFALYTGATVNLTFNSESEPNNQSIILPDGNVARFGIEYHDGGYQPTSVDNGNRGYVCAFYTAITTQNNVSKVYVSNNLAITVTELDDDSSFPGSSLKANFRNCWVTAINADSYPVTALLVAKMNSSDFGYRNDAVIAVSKVTISNASSVSYENSYTDVSPNYKLISILGPTSSKNFCWNPAFLPDNSLVYCDCGYHSNDEIIMRASKVTPQGVCTAGTVKRLQVSENYGAYQDSTIHEMAGYCVKDGSSSIFSPTSNQSGAYSGRISVDNSTLTITYPSSTAVPSEYKFQRVGEFYSLSNNTINKTYWDYSPTQKTSTEGTLPFPVFSQGLDIVKNASVLILGSYEDVSMAYLINSGSNTRVLYYDEDDRIGVYNYLTNTSSGSGVSITPLAASRNEYRNRIIGNSVLILSDDAGSVSQNKTGQDTLSLLIVNL